MDTKKLRQKILDLAIRGKLVPQDPSDEPASVLVEKIRAEKEQLIREKKIKRDKNESYIYRSDKSYYEKFAHATVKCIDEEIPFEIPESWEWCRLNMILSKLTDGTHHSPVNLPSGDFMYITAKNIKFDGISLKDITYVSKDIHKEIFSRCNPEKGDILYIKDGATTGVATINSMSNPFSMLSSVALLKPMRYLNNHYLLGFLQSPICYNFTRNNMKGVGITRVTLAQMSRWLIPIAPLQEQNRIVEKIDFAFALIGDIEADKLDLIQFVKTTKSKILDLAIRGKLVPQDPNDEPASVLLERIKAEQPESKKKAKNAGDNSHYQNLPFEIPENWMWVRGYSCFNPMESTRPTEDSFIYIDIDAIDNKTHKVINPKTIKKQYAPSRATRKISTGDTLFSMVRPYLENIAFIDCSLNNCIASTGFYVCKPNALLFPIFCFNLMTSKYVINGLNSFMKGDNSPSINNENILNWLYPIPPFEEQIRITKTINSLYTMLDNITAEL